VIPIYYSADFCILNDKDRMSLPNEYLVEQGILNEIQDGSQNVQGYIWQNVGKDTTVIVSVTAKGTIYSVISVCADKTTGLIKTVSIFLTYGSMPSFFLYCLNSDMNVRTHMIRILGGKDQCYNPFPDPNVKSLPLETGLWELYDNRFPVVISDSTTLPLAIRKCLVSFVVLHTFAPSAQLSFTIDGQVQPSGYDELYTRVGLVGKQYPRYVYKMHQYACVIPLSFFAIPMPNFGRINGRWKDAAIMNMITEWDSISATLYLYGRALNGYKTDIHNVDW